MVSCAAIRKAIKTGSATSSAVIFTPKRKFGKRIQNIRTRYRAEVRAMRCNLLASCEIGLLVIQSAW